MKDNENDNIIDNEDKKVGGGDAIAEFRKAADERKKAELIKEAEREKAVAEAERRQR
jgi:hypothetical protein